MRILYLKIIFNIRLGLYRIYLILKININIFLHMKNINVNRNVIFKFAKITIKLKRNQFHRTRKIN